ncbi:phosphate acetyltransferase, partial [Candidatus Riflebacteria bacterium]
LTPVLVGRGEELHRIAKENQLSLNDIEILDLDQKKKEVKDAAFQYYELRKHKGLTYHQAQQTLEKPLYFATMLLKNGAVDGVISGSMSPTADVIRASVQVVKTAPGISVVSGAMIMASPHKELGNDGLFVFADVGVNPNPDSEQLAQIACSSAQTAKALLNFDPQVALLSFSTKGSARHGDVDKVLSALESAQKMEPELKIDGELQLDAAIIPKVGESKAKGSKVAGRANVLIFPDLDAGNIGYKLVQRFGKAIAAGPIIQGLRLPMNDLSRGCKVEDIYHLAAITAVQAQMTEK